jgi:APA family basic amino acid/polyamine antiporter
VRPPEESPDEDHPALRAARRVLSESLQRSLERALVPEALFTIASDAWREIARVARGHDCETVLLGLPHLTEPGVEPKLGGLLAELDADLVIVRAPHRWHMAEAKRVLVPLGGQRDHSHLRARLLASMSRAERSVTFLHTYSSSASAETRRRLERDLRALARDEAAGPHEVVVEYTDDRREALVRRAAEADLVVLGIQRRGRGQHVLGELALAVAHETQVPLVLISRRRARSQALKGTMFRSYRPTR